MRFIVVIVAVIVVVLGLLGFVVIVIIVIVSFVGLVIGVRLVGFVIGGGGSIGGSVMFNEQMF